MWVDVIFILEAIVLLGLFLTIGKDLKKIDSNYYLKVIRDNKKAEFELNDIRELRDEFRKIDSEEELKLWQAHANAHNNAEFSPLGLLLGFFITLITGAFSS